MVLQMIETMQKCCDKVKTKQEKKRKQMNNSVTALKNKHVLYPSSSWINKLSIAITK